MNKCSILICPTKTHCETSVGDGTTYSKIDSNPTHIHIRETAKVNCHFASPSNDDPHYLGSIDNTSLTKIHHE